MALTFPLISGRGSWRNSKLARDIDPYVGWTRSPQDGPFPEYSSAAIQKLKDNVVEDMVERRKSKANRNSTAHALVK
jgi:hypothetical protein